jgi:hypothetical protein
MTRHAQLVAFGFTAIWLVTLTLPALAEDVKFSTEQVEYFEKEVRPLLVEHCLKCHGDEKQKGDLRLDSREAALKGAKPARRSSPASPRRAN